MTRLVSWNIHGSAEPNPIVLAEALRRFAPDIVCLQETRWQQARLIARAFGWPRPAWVWKHNGWVVIPSRTEGMAILSSRRTRDTETPSRQQVVPMVGLPPARRSFGGRRWPGDRQRSSRHRHAACTPQPSRGAGGLRSTRFGDRWRPQRGGRRSSDGGTRALRLEARDPQSIIRSTTSWFLRV